MVACPQRDELISPSILLGCSHFPASLSHGSCKTNFSLYLCISQHNVHILATLVVPLSLPPVPHGPLLFFKEEQCSSKHDMFLHRISKNISLFSQFHKNSCFPSPCFAGDDLYHHLFTQVKSENVP